MLTMKVFSRRRLSLRSAIVGPVVCVMGLMGCSEQPSPVVAPVSKAPAIDSKPEVTTDTIKTAPYEATVGGVKFTVPAAWEQKPPKSEFVLGEFSVPGEAGAGRLTLSSAGGGIEDNIGRWRDQFIPGPNDPEPKESEVTFDGNKGTLVELAGTYSDMLSRGQNKNWRMLGVAVPMGATNFFVKLTGPAATVTAARDEFLKFVESAKVDK